MCASRIASDDAVSIDVLIGANCTEALELIDFITSKNGGPYALETVLGWCVMGPIGSSCKGDDVVSCNRIAAQDAGTKLISRHHFEIQKEMKDTEISNMIERMYQLDFVEPRTKLKDLMTNRLDELSYEDRKFLKIVADQVVKFGNRYKTTLALRNPEMTLPNKGVMAEKRAHYLERKLTKDEQYFSHYKISRMKSLREVMQECHIKHHLMASCGIYLIMGFIIRQNPIKLVLYLTAMLSMQVDLLTKSFWLDLT